MRPMMFLLSMAILGCLIYTVMYATPESQHISVGMAHVFPVFEGENSDLKTFAVMMMFLIFILGLIRLLVNGRKQ
ncbi:hypothetical protein ACFL6S_32130 [Candidatus Poribacteria bacterium]